MISSSRASERRASAHALVVLLLVGIACGVGYLIAQANSKQKRRELNIQQAIFSTPAGPHLVHEWDPSSAVGEQNVRNWSGMSNAYDTLDAKSVRYPILRAGLVESGSRRAVLVWLDAQRSDGFDIEYAVVEPGNWLFKSHVVGAGRHSFLGAKSDTPTRVWSAAFAEANRSQCTFEFEIAGLRQVAQATLSGSKFTFTVTQKN